MRTEWGLMYLHGLLTMIQILKDNFRSVETKGNADLHSSGSESELLTRHTCSSSLINVDDFHKLSRLAATMSWLDKFLGLLNNGVKLDLCKCACQLGITTSGLASGNVTKTSLAHGLLAGGKVESLWQAHCLAFSSTDHVNRQCASC